MPGYKQKKLLEIAKRDGTITTTTAKGYYTDWKVGLNALRGLEVLGVLEFVGNGTWRYIDGQEEES